MIEYPTWRNLFYKLAGEYPDCLMLNFTIKVQSDTCVVYLHVLLELYLCLKGNK